MDLLSLKFISFFAIVFSLYYLVPGKYQNLVLLGASLVFFLSWNVWDVVILLIIALSNFFIGNRIEQGTNKKRWLITGISINIMAIAFFKTAHNAAITKLIGTLFHVEGFQALTTELLIPIGLSFYALQGISYIIDISQGTAKASSDFLQFGVYMAYFPKVLAGPIERANRFLPILRQEKALLLDNIRRGANLILLGIVRKVVIANGLNSTIPQSLFIKPNEYNAIELALFLFLYSFWLYNDFAGYTNIACGISLMFGIELTPNFRQPYLSPNYTEFWSRWHISFASWLRDYIFLPVNRYLLRRNRNSGHIVNLAIPPMLTMLISGLWHDFGRNMLIWGALHGTYLIGNQLLKRNQTMNRLVRNYPFFDKIRTLLVFLLVSFAWVFFASDKPTAAFTFIRGLVSFPVNLQSFTLSTFYYPIFLIGTCLFIDWMQDRSKDELFYLKWPILIRSGIYSIIITWLVLLQILQINLPSSGFLYQGF